ncbi:partial Glucose--fructose oxidoreductase, partial [Anaerolineae bacterium]
MSQNRINIAIVGLGFGAEFIPIYQRHPHARLEAICQRTPEKLDAIGDAFGIAKRYTDYRDLLADPEVQAVHINTPIPDHAEMSLAALRAGKHVACTVPMATSVADCRKIVELQRKTGLKYMMFETSCFHEDLHAMRTLYRAGALGELVYSEGEYYHYMETPIPSFNDWRV